jgi:CheY-like chemotaxis protein
MKKVDIACIIDDDPVFVFGIKRIMQLADFCNGFLVFRNGKEALDHFHAIIENGEKVPEVILLDINMPVMDGWEFLEEFTKIQAKNPITIYIVTSSIDPADFKRAQQFEDITNYLVKPIAVDKLRQIITNLNS